MCGICRNMSLSVMSFSSVILLLFANCMKHTRLIWPKLVKYLTFLNMLWSRKIKTGKSAVVCFFFFFLLIFQPQTKHLWCYWKSQLWYKKMFLLKILSQLFWAGVVCGFLKESASLGQCSMNGVEIWSVCPRVTPIPWDSVLRHSLPYFSLLFYCGYSN